MHPWATFVRRRAQRSAQGPAVG